MIDLHPEENILIRYILEEEKNPTIEKHISDCSVCRKKIEILKKSFSPSFPDMRPGKENAMREYLRQAARKKLQSTKEQKKPSFKRRYIYAFEFAAAACIIGVVLFFSFKTKTKEYLISYKSSDPKIIKSRLKNDKAILPFEIKSQKNDICDIAGFLKGKYRFIGPGNLKLLPPDNNDKFVMEINSGILLVNTFGPVKSLNIKTPKASIVITGTKFLISSKAKELKIVVFKGQVKVINNKEDLILDSGQGIQTKRGQIKKENNGLKILNYNEKKICRLYFSKVKSLKQKIKKLHAKGFLEKIYLKDGSFVTGKVILQDKKKLILQTQLGKVTVNRKDVLRIEYLEKK